MSPGSCPAVAWVRMHSCVSVLNGTGNVPSLVHLDRRAPLLVQQALYWDEALPDLPCVFIITTTGSILQGDRFNIEIDLAPDTRAHITTQAATKIHSMDANYATQISEHRVG